MIRGGVRVPLFILTLAVVTGGYAYAQFGQDIFGGFGALRGEQGDLAERPPERWPDPNVTACHMLYTSVRREANGAGWRTD